MPSHTIIFYKILLIQANRQMTMPSEKPDGFQTASLCLNRYCAYSSDLSALRRDTLIPSCLSLR